MVFLWPQALSAYYVTLAVKGRKGNDFGWAGGVGRKTLCLSRRI